MHCQQQVPAAGGFLHSIAQHANVQPVSDNSLPTCLVVLLAELLIIADKSRLLLDLAGRSLVSTATATQLYTAMHSYTAATVMSGEFQGDYTHVQGVRIVQHRPTVYTTKAKQAAAFPPAQHTLHVMFKPCNNQTRDWFMVLLLTHGSLPAGNQLEPDLQRWQQHAMHAWAPLQKCWRVPGWQCHGAMQPTTAWGHATD